MLSIFKGFQRELARDAGSVFFVAVFPVLMVFILGTTLASLDNPDSVIGRMEIAYCVDSDDASVEHTAKWVVEQFDDIEQIKFTESADMDRAKAQLEQGELASLVVFKDSFDIEIHEGLKLIENKAAYSIFTSVSRMYGSMAAITKLSMMDAITNDPSLLTPEAFAFDSNGLGSNGLGGNALGGSPAGSAPAGSFSPGFTEADISALLDSLRIEEKEYGVSRTMMDYYAITMIVMMFFMGSFFSGAMTFYDTRKNGTLRRMLASPLNRTSVYLQYVTSQIPLNLAQILIVMLISSTFFGAHYAATWQLNLLLFAMLLIVSMACACVSLIIGLFIKFNPIILLMPVMWPLLFLCGTFKKEISIPGVSEYLPPSLIQQAAFDLTLFGNTSSSIAVLLVSAAIIVVASFVGSVLFNKRELAS